MAKGTTAHATSMAASTPNRRRRVRSTRYWVARPDKKYVGANAHAIAVSSGRSYTFAMRGATMTTTTVSTAPAAVLSQNRLSRS